MLNQQQNKDKDHPMRAAIFITARLKSQRLKQKVLKPLAGVPMLDHLVARLRQSRFGDTIILCTSTLGDDDALEQRANALGINCFRGHPDDVLARNVDAAKAAGVDLVLSCTADNPFVDPQWMDKLADKMLAEQADFGTMSNLPLGAFSYSFTTAAGIKACAQKTETDTEIWGQYFKEDKAFKCVELIADDPAVSAPELRITVDTADDFTVAEAIATHFNSPTTLPSLADIVAYLRANPETANLNAHVVQRTLATNIGSGA